jgi:hypothetical protein
MDESSSVTDRVILAPIIPMDEIATTPITIPSAARTERRKWSRILRSESWKITSLAIMPPSRHEW